MDIGEAFFFKHRLVSERRMFRDDSVRHQKPSYLTRPAEVRPPLS
jgi:hypothetical protein